VRVQDLSEGRDARPARHFAESLTESVRANEITLVGLVDRPFESGWRKDAGEIDQGVHRIYDGKSVDAGRVPLEVRAPVYSESRSRSTENIAGN